MILKNYILITLFIFSLFEHKLTATPQANTYSCKSSPCNLTTFPIAASIIASIVSSLGYATYLDYCVNHKEALSHWALHHMNNGTIDQLELSSFIQNNYPKEYHIHQLSAAFALLHAIEKEIGSCLTLRSILHMLRRLRLQRLLSETETGLDKKLENLYLLKHAVNNWSTEMHTRYRTRALS